MYSETPFNIKLPKKESPNFIFIYTDDQRFDTIGLISQNEVITPNLDRLAKSGAIMSNTYNMGGWHGAVCVASRSMIISGKSLWKAKENLDSENIDIENDDQSSSNEEFSSQCLVIMVLFSINR